MKLTLATTLTAIAIVGGSALAVADDDGNYRDLWELKQLHAAFHRAVSHAGVEATGRAQHIKDILALWTDDGVLITGGVAYSGKGTPGTASCAPGSLTLCDLYTNIAGAFKLGNEWVSLTPIFTESITVVDSDHADLYFQCIYFTNSSTPEMKSSVTYGLPGMPNTGRARRVNGHWRLSYAESTSVPPPPLDVYQ
jgi:hypothetical protein